ncbi:unnamed protein product, partial [Choristocarpus tenellus]
YCIQQGILQECISPWTPGDNGLAKRQWRTLLNKVGCLLNTTDLPKQLWTDAIATATLVNNFSPTSTLHFNASYHPWHSHPLDLSPLSIFGAWAYVLHDRSRRGKLAPTT